MRSPTYRLPSDFWHQSYLAIQAQHARGTRTGSAAISINACHIIFNGRFHHGHAGNPIGFNFRAVVLNKNDLGHNDIPIAVVGVLLSEAVAIGNRGTVKAFVSLV
jgi:hypothetical protein